MRLRITFVVAALALAVGVTAAWAGFPHFKSADSTFEEGTTTKGGGKKTTTTLSATLETAAKAPDSTPGYAPAIITVQFKASGVTGDPWFRGDIAGTQTWACANWGGGWPADPKKVNGPIGDFNSPIVDVTDRSGNIDYRGNEIEIVLLPPAGFACPSGQTALIVALGITNLEIEVYEGGDPNQFLGAYPVKPPTSSGWDGYNYSRVGYPG